MRIPLVRFGSDLTPIAEWEWKWLPIIVPVLIVLLLVVLPIFIILGYVTLLGYGLVGLFLPNRSRKKWFAGLGGGFPALDEIERAVRERQSRGVMQVPEE